MIAENEGNENNVKGVLCVVNISRKRDIKMFT